MTRRSLGALAVMAVTTALLALPSAAPAEQVTLGPALDQLLPPMSGSNCPMTGTCTEVQNLLAGNLVPPSPVNGVITGWSVRAFVTGSGYRLRVLSGEYGVGKTFTALRSSSPSAAVAAGSTMQLPTGLPIAIGDQIGLRVPGGVSVPQFASPAGGVNSITNTQFPVDPEDGSSGKINGAAGGVLGVNATISFCRVPALTGKKLKKAKAALAAETCASKKVKRGRTHSHKKSKKVNRQSLVAGTTVAPGTVVQLFVKKFKG